MPIVLYRLISLMALSCFFAATIFAKPAPAHKVFQLESQVMDPNTLLFQWAIKPGNFLYKDKVNIRADQHQTLGPLRLPTTDVEKAYPNKSYRVYRDTLALPVSLLHDKPGNYHLKISYQGCADSGFCYPPTTAWIALNVNKELGLTSAKVEPSAFTSTTNSESQETPTSQAETTSYISLFQNNNLFFIMVSFYGLGLLLAFTPCVLPMVPVLSGIIVGQHKTIDSRKATFLSLSYVLGMAFTYALVGILIAALGKNLQTAFQSPFAVGTFASLFILLGLAMFDAYELKLPQRLQAKLATYSKSHNNGAYLGAATMGMLSTLILSPCVTAPLVGVLGYIAQTGDRLLGGLSLLCLGLGMGTPLLLVGISAGKYLPKAGQWMNGVKHFFGVLMLIIALTLFERILPPYITMVAWSALLISVGVALYSQTASMSSSSNLKSVIKALSIMAVTYGLLILIGVALGNRSPYTPLKDNQPTLSTATIRQPSSRLTPLHVTDLKGMQEALTQAKMAKKPVMIDFYADWCASCKTLETTLLQDPKVTRYLNLKGIQWIKADVTKRNEASLVLEKRFEVIAPPTFIFISSDGGEVSRRVGEITKDILLSELKKLAR